MVAHQVERRARNQGAAWCEQADAAVVFVGLSEQGLGFFDHRHTRKELREALGLLPGRPMFTDDAATLRGSPAAKYFADILRLAELRAKPPEAVVILRDTDDDADVVPGSELAICWFHERVRKISAVVIGTPHRDAEGWLVAGLHHDEAVTERRDYTRRKLGFDPCTSPERLSSAPNNAPQDAKRVLAFLLGDGQKLSEVPSRPPHPKTSAGILDEALKNVEELERRTNKCGLSALLRAVNTEIATRAVPGRP